MQRWSEKGLKENSLWKISHDQRNNCINSIYKICKVKKKKTFPNCHGYRLLRKTDVLISESSKLDILHNNDVWSDVFEILPFMLQIVLSSLSLLDSLMCDKAFVGLRIALWSYRHHWLW